jgi:hypothetical protein
MQKRTNCWSRGRETSEEKFEREKKETVKSVTLTVKGET